MRCHTYTEITGNLITEHTHHTQGCTHHNGTEKP